MALKALYHLNDVYDASGNLHTLSNTGTVTFTQAIFGNGANYGSSNSSKQLGIADNLDIDGGNITVVLMFKLLSEIGSGYWDIFCQASSTSKVINHIWYEYNSGTRRLNFDRAKNGIANQQFYYNVTLGTSNWHTIVYTYDGSYVRGYLDGSYLNQAAASGSGSSATTSQFFIGYSGIWAYWSSAIYDECAVYDEAKSQSWVAKQYAWAKGKLL